MTRETLVVFVLVAALCLGLWVWNMTHVPALVNDDAFLYMRYAVNWVDHGTLAWNRDGAGSDGFTSFAYQALAALAYLIAGDDPVSAQWYVAALASAATVLLTLWMPLSGNLGLGLRAAMTVFAACAATCISSALNPQFAYYTHSLMESSLVAFTVCLAAWATAHLLTDSPQSRLWTILAGSAVGVLALVRPEGLLVTAAVCVLLGIRIAGARLQARPFRALVASVDARAFAPLVFGLLTAVLIAGAYFFWHLERYHYPFPNPVYVKTAGVTPESIQRGIRYLMNGPQAGNLPLAAVRTTATAPAEPVAWETVHAAVTPDRHPAAYWGLLALIPFLWVLTFQGPLFFAPREALFLRHFLLVPTGWLVLVVLAGGDTPHSGWRFVTPLLPAVTLAAVVGTRSSRFPQTAGLLVVMLTALLGRTVVVALDRPERCEQAASACGAAAILRWPPSLETYEWDVSNAWYDKRVAQALRASFSPEATIGQADFLRIGVHLPEFTIADLSGLTDGELAHAPHAPDVRLFNADLLVAKRPAVYLYGYQFISNGNLASYRLDDPLVGQLLHPWPPEGSAEALRDLVWLYAGASVSFPNGTYFNFLVLREAVPTMLSREHVQIGP